MTPPQNHEHLSDPQLEYIVLSYLIVLNEGVFELEEEDFYMPLHKDLFIAIRQAHVTTGNIDLFSVSLVYPGEKHDVYGLMGVETYTMQYSPTQICTLRDTLKSYTLRRNIIHAGKCASILTTQALPTEELIHKVQTTFNDAIDVPHLGKVKNGQEIMLGVSDQWLEDIDTMQEGREAQTGFSTRISTIDNVLQYCAPDSYVLLAANASMGKTTFALNIAYKAAREGKRVLFFSLEMSEQSIVEKVLSIHTGVPIREHIREKKLNASELIKLIDEAQPILENILVSSRGITTASQIRTHTYMQHKQKKLDMIVVDYIQQITPENERQNTTDQIGNSSKILVSIAKELRIPVLCLSQLSRENQKRKSWGRKGFDRPQLSDLRGSGNLEQDADVVLMLYSESYQAQQTQKSKQRFMEVWIRKHRVGAVGAANTIFYLDTGRVYPNNKSPVPDLDADTPVNDLFPEDGPQLWVNF